MVLVCNPVPECICIRSNIYGISDQCVATGALTFGASTVVAILLLAVVLYLLFRKDPYKGKAVSVERSVAEA